MLPTLTFIHEVIRERQLVGGAAIIYTRMFDLAMVDNFTPYASIQTKIEGILAHIRDVNERKARCHAIGDLLVKELHPRFIKDGPLRPDETRETHCIDWINKNHALNPDTDFEWVCAGFMAMFQ